jgi:hypothetical protein
MDNFLDTISLSSVEGFFRSYDQIFEHHKNSFFKTLGFSIDDFGFDLSISSNPSLFYKPNNTLTISFDKNHIDFRISKEKDFPLENKLYQEYSVLKSIAYIFPFHKEKQFEKFSKKYSSSYAEQLHLASYSFSKSLSLLYLRGVYEKDFSSQEQTTASELFLSSVSEKIYRRNIVSQQDKKIFHSLHELKGFDFNDKNIGRVFIEHLKSSHPFFFVFYSG